MAFIGSLKLKSEGKSMLFLNNQGDVIDNLSSRSDSYHVIVESICGRPAIGFNDFGFAFICHF